MATEFTVQGRIVRVLPQTSKEHNGKTYKEQKLWLKIDEDTQYPQTIVFDIADRQQEYMDRHPEGSVVTAKFNMRGREYTDKQGQPACFSSPQIWRLESVGQQPAPQQGGGYATQANPAGGGATQTSSFYNPPRENPDDLPF